MSVASDNRDNGWIHRGMLRPEVGPGVRLVRTVASAVGPYRLVKSNTAGRFVEATFNDADVEGINSQNVDIATGTIHVAKNGHVTGVHDIPVAEGDYLKAYYDGKVGPLFTSDQAGVTIDTSVGDAFANQPANDTVEVVSSSALDVGIRIRVYGTRTAGTTGVVYTEDILTNGVTAVASTTVTDWATILGFEIPYGYPLAAGTITLQEGSGNLAIDTLAAGSRLKGIVNVPTADTYSYNTYPNVVADAGTTKTVGVWGTNSAGTEIGGYIALTGAVAVEIPRVFRTVTKILVGDLEVARTATFRTDSDLDNLNLCIGRASAAATTADSTCTFELYDRGTLVQAVLDAHGSKSVTMPALGVWAEDGDGLLTNGGGFLGDYTATAMTVDYAKVYDAGNTEYNPLATSSAGTDITGNFQVMSDTKNAGDQLLLGFNTPVAEFGINTSATVGVYTGDGVKWQYWNGSAWADLTITDDNTDTTAQDGLRPFQQDGAVMFAPPADWAASTIDGQLAYWLASTVVTGANVGTIALLADEHSIAVPSADGWKAPYAGKIKSIRAADGNATLHTAADVTFVLLNYETGVNSGELTWAQDQRYDQWDVDITVAEGDRLYIVVLNEDGTNEITNAMLTFDIEAVV